MASAIGTAIAAARSEALPKKRRDLNPSHEALRQAFNLASRDGSGLLRQRELRIAMMSLGFSIPKDTAAHLVETSENAEKGGAGGVPFDQFCGLVKEAAASFDVRKDVANTFLLFLECAPPAPEGASGAPEITLAHLVRACEAMGVEPDVPELQSMIDVAGRNASAGRIDLETFYTFMQQHDFFTRA